VLLLLLVVVVVVVVLAAAVVVAGVVVMVVAAVVFESPSIRGRIFRRRVFYSRTARLKCRRLVVVSPLSM
jgi:hypothetical protein